MQPTGPAKTSRTTSTRGLRCRQERHVFAPFKESPDLGGGAQKCECGKVLIDRTLGGGRVVEIKG